MSLFDILEYAVLNINSIYDGALSMNSIILKSWLKIYSIKER